PQGPSAFVRLRHWEKGAGGVATMATVKSAGLGFLAAIGIGLVSFPSASKADVYNFLDSSNNVFATATTSLDGSNVKVDIAITAAGMAAGWYFIQAGNPPMIGWNSDTPTLAQSPTQNPGGPVTWALTDASKLPFNSGGAGDFTQGLGFTPKAP